ncbi:MAG: hypothetical protein H0X25_17720 [Acidobacteriales bacterium]|nr:hypothetical protein [Terriglobales bacterium]
MLSTEQRYEGATFWPVTVGSDSEVPTKSHASPLLAGQRRNSDRRTQLVPLGFWATCIASVSFWAVFIWRSAFTVGGGTYFVLFDDAMISMRYARNLAEGHGLVWNAGGPRVEGISNPLWTLWMAVLHLLPVGDAHQSLLVMLSSAVALLGTLWVVRRLAEALTDDGRVVLMAVALTAASYPLVFWALRGMEVGVLALLLTYAALCAIRQDPVFAARTGGPGWSRMALAGSGIAAIAVRLDAIAPVALITFFAVWRTARPQRRSTAVKVGAPLFGAIVLMTAARRLYYGDWLPNTYYLKATGVSLSTRFRVGGQAMVKVSIIHLGVLLLLAAFGLAQARRRPAIFMLAGIVLIQMAYSVWVGGDAWEVTSFSNRYVTVVIPALAIVAAFGLVSIADERSGARRFGTFLILGALLAVLAAAYGGRSEVDGAGIDNLASWRPLILLVAGGAAVVGGGIVWRRPRLPPAAVLGFLGLLTVLVTNFQGASFWWRRNALQLGQEIALTREGLLFHSFTTPDAVIAVYAAGASPYFSHHPSVDVFGKSDRYIAHLKGNPDLPFRPGHNKEDLSYSLRTYHPDIVQSIGVGFVGEARALLIRDGYGFTTVNGMPFAVRRSSHRISSRVLDAITPP